jgi:FkbM family methyltransferase
MGLLEKMLKKLLLKIYQKCFKILSGHGIGNFYVVRKANRLLKTRLRSTYAEVDGHKMFLDSRDILGLSTEGTYEPFETEIVKREIKKSDVALDIGANIGYYTLLFARLVGEEGKVFAFEPDPYNFSLLQKNVEINGYKNVELIPKAVSNETGKSRLYFKNKDHVQNMIFDNHTSLPSAEIETTRLDDYFANYQGKIDFIKMDIQGAEGRAIQGMDYLLKINSGMKIAMEFEPASLILSGMEPGKCLKLLVAHGYNLYQIVTQERIIKPVILSELLKIYTPGKKTMTNLLCLREPLSISLKSFLR